MSGRIVFINQATGYLTIDILNAFTEAFDEVALITGSIRIQSAGLKAKVNVTKIVKYNRGSNIRKAFSWFLGTLQIWFYLKTKYRDFERVYFTIPPTAYLLALCHRTPFSIVVYDLYPEALLIHRLSQSGHVIKWWSDQNRKVFREADKIFTLSEYMRSQILGYFRYSDVRVVPNWSAFSNLKRIEKQGNMLIRNEGLEGRFIVQYSGNIGVSHNVEVLLDVAERLSSYKDIVFLIIGRGEKSATIRDMISGKKLSNCRILSFRKDEELFDSLCAADLAVITLDDKIPDISVPSKIYNIMSAGTPVLAIASLESGLASIIAQHQMGKVFDKNNTEGMCQFIEDLMNRPEFWTNLSENCLRASQNYTAANAYKYLDYYNEKTD